MERRRRRGASVLLERLAGVEYVVCKHVDDVAVQMWPNDNAQRGQRLGDPILNAVAKVGLYAIRSMMKACGFASGKRLCQRMFSKIFETPFDVIDQQ